MIGKTVLNDWKVESVIGKGSFGSVYRITKEEYGVSSESALKVITVPQSESDLLSIMNEGMDEASVTTYFKGVVDDIVKEISIMSKLKGHPNIVGYEDHKVIAKADTVGWDILIRMELLKSLVDYQMSNGFTIEQVVNLGIELADALTLCHSRGLIHRDIKPDNIFVNDYGVFKLGDFGVARNVENAMSVKSKKGTEVYMAPEVYLGKSYDSTVDLYSLGIVLYKCLNNNRLPFLPPAGQPIRPGDRETALIKRVEGTPIPRPAHGDDDLVRIVLKTVEFYPGQRYATAKELLNDLKRYLATHQDSVGQLILAAAPAPKGMGITKSSLDVAIPKQEAPVVKPDAPAPKPLNYEFANTPLDMPRDVEATVGVSRPTGYNNQLPIGGNIPPQPIPPVMPVTQVPNAGIDNGEPKKPKKKKNGLKIVGIIAAAVAVVGVGIFVATSVINRNDDSSSSHSVARTEPTKKPTNTPKPTKKPTTTPTPKATNTPKPTNSPTPTATSTPTPLPTSTPTPATTTTTTGTNDPELGTFVNNSDSEFCNSIDYTGWAVVGDNYIYEKKVFNSGDDMVFEVNMLPTGSFSGTVYYELYLYETADDDSPDLITSGSVDAKYSSNANVYYYDFYLSNQYKSGYYALRIWDDINGLTCLSAVTKIE